MASSDATTVDSASGTTPAVTATTTASTAAESTAHKEMSRDFAAQMKSRFALKGPQPPHKVTEGRNTDTSSEHSSPTSVNNIRAPTVEGPLLNIDIVTQSLDLLAELHSKYGLDPAFQPILDRPNDFRNFKVDGQLIYKKAENKKLLCIPKVMIQG